MPGVCRDRGPGSLQCVPDALPGTDRRRDGPSSVVMRVEAGPVGPPLRALLSPLRVPSSPFTCSRDSRHVLMIYEPSAGVHMPKRILTDLYCLSEAEAALTLLLFAGESLESARSTSTSRHTAKTHLHHIFLKCDVSLAGRAAAAAVAGSEDAVAGRLRNVIHRFPDR